VIPADLSILAQAQAGTPIRFELITLAQADEIMAAPVSISTLSTRLSPLVRDPREMSDLLSYQLISGAITGC
jgi:allophanate hydrolase